jgi:hypothetical protein
MVRAYRGDPAVHAPVPDFTDAEQALVAEILQRRYGKKVPVEPAESELRLDPGVEALTVCPTLYWSERGAHFVVCKVGGARYRCQFFYTDADHYGTGHDEYDDLRICVRTLLQIQADHEKQSAGVSSGATAIDLADDDYHGPPIL